MRTGDDSLAVFGVGLEALDPIGTGIRKTLQCQRTLPRKGMTAKLLGLEGSVEQPGVVGRVEIVRRDKDQISIRLCRFEDPLHVFHGLVFGDAGTDRFPRRSLRTKDLVLRIDEHYRRVALLHLEFMSHFALLKFTVRWPYTSITKTVAI